jgi:hypothetical protein
VLEIGRDLADGDECVALVVGRAMQEGLQAALDVEGGCGWVNPACGHEGERGKRPQSHRHDDKPSKKGTEAVLPKRGLGRDFWTWSHIPE